ncbi:unnamed protein product [Paramecium sonneborni]|uniref:Uncharacterized protein n=1 Tax=Paramecium sonneborni TaxID=65129 RepID=A0A8S1ND12_9CILI|nr:unnamed protein product [Paramecium sonneborni]
MKIIYILLSTVYLCKAQINMAFCDEYIEYDVNNFGKFISNVKLSNSTDAILAEKRVLIIDDNLNVLSSMSIPKTQTHNCEWIFNYNNDTFFVGCQKNGEAPYLIAYKSINKTHYAQFGEALNTLLYLPKQLELQAY